MSGIVDSFVSIVVVSLLPVLDCDHLWIVRY